MNIAAQLNVENYDYMAAQPPRGFEWLRIDPNYNCNVHCVYCHSSRSDQIISLEQLSAFLDSNVTCLENVQFGCIMEPTLDPRLANVMQRVGNSSVQPTGDMVVQTNALLLHQHDHQQMLAAGLTHLSVSIDSIDPVILARLRGGSSFNKVSRNVVEFKKCCPDVNLQILTTVTKANIDAIDDLVSWGIDVGAARFVLREVFHYPNNPVVNHEETVKLLLDGDQFATMQDRLVERFGDQTIFHFAPSENLRRHIVNVHKQSYRRKPDE